MSSTERMLAWIQSLPGHSTTPLLYATPTSSRKRKKPTASSPSRQHLGSPPTSHSKMASTPRKRRREGSFGPHPLFDPDATPRPSESRAHSTASVASESSSVASSSAASSLKKQIMSLRLVDSGIECLELDPDAAPKTARNVVDALMEAGMGHSILPDASKEATIDKLRARGMDPHRWKYSFQLPGEADTLPGRIPSFEEVEKVRAKAKECQNHGHEEASWNSQVHLRLLEYIFEEVLGGPCGDFNAVSCTTARPHRDFKPISSPLKLIDMCVYTYLGEDEKSQAALSALSKITPTQTVNHTDYQPTQHRPIVLSIETKKPGVHWDRAQLQIGVWHAAQWAFLRWGVGQSLMRKRLADGLRAPETEDERAEFTAQKLAVMDTLGFIPGIIIQGHKWLFVLSTYRDGKTKLLTDLQFGSTQTLLQIYEAVAGVRHLMAWARDVYVPWFKEHVLCYP